MLELTKENIKDLNQHVFLMQAKGDWYLLKAREGFDNTWQWFLIGPYCYWNGESSKEEQLSSALNDDRCEVYAIPFEIYSDKLNAILELAKGLSC